MIILLRHQEGNSKSNCLSKKGIRHIKQIVKQIKKYKNISIFTRIPSLNGKHVRPLQTASILGSILNRSVNFIENYVNLPSKDDKNTSIIIWNHEGIGDILKSYFWNSDFKWNDNNYAGAIIIEKTNWYYVNNFLKSDSYLLFRMIECFH